MRIVRAELEDVGALVRAKGLFDSPPSAEATRAYLQDDRNIVLLALEGTEPVGFLRGTRLGQLRSPRPQMFLYEIAVAPESRRQGIAKALVVALLDHCRARNYAEVFVLADPGNVAAVRLYRSTGATTETPADRMFVYRLSP